MNATEFKLNLNELKAERIRKGLSQEKLAEFYQIAQAMGCTKTETNSLLKKMTGE